MGAALSRCTSCGAEYEGRLERCPLDGAPLIKLAEDATLGQRIGGRFVVEGSLGSGTSATVYRARDEQSAERVALKLLAPRHTADEVARFEREARAVQKIVHPNVVAVTESGLLPDGRAYLVMPLMTGDPLSAWTGRPLDPLEALEVAEQVARGLSRAHREGVVHRDVKPANIFVRRIPGGVHAQVLDFGMAQILGESPITRSGLVTGTPAYMSPEQAEGLRASEASDIYSLGVTLFELLTGRRPFGGNVPELLSAHMDRDPPRPSALVETLPPGFDDLVFHMMDKRTRHRPTASMLAPVLGAFRSAPPHRDDPVRQWRWANAVLVALGEASAGALVDALEQRAETHRAMGEPLRAPDPRFALDPEETPARAVEPPSFERVLEQLERVEAGIVRDWEVGPRPPERAETRWVLTPDIAERLAKVGEEARVWLSLRRELVRQRRLAEVEDQSTEVPDRATTDNLVEHLRRSVDRLRQDPRVRGLLPVARLSGPTRTMTLRSEP